MESQKVEMLVENVEKLKKIMDIRQQLEKLEGELPIPLRQFLHDGFKVVNKDDKERTRIDPNKVITAIKGAYVSEGTDILTKAKLVEITGYDAARITNAITKMGKDIGPVAADKKKEKSKKNTAYKIKQ